MLIADIMLFIMFFFVLFFYKNEVILIALIGAIPTVTGLYFGYNVYQKKIIEDKDNIHGFYST